MIYPSIYSFNAPKRGPKESNEINKLFTSIVHDIVIAKEELALIKERLSNNMGFFVSTSGQVECSFPSTGNIEEANYAYRGIDNIQQSVDELDMLANNILADIQGE